MDKGLLLVVFLCLPLISSVCEGSFTRVRSSSFSFLGRYRVGMSSPSFASWRLGKTLICYGLSIPSVTILAILPVNSAYRNRDKLRKCGIECNNLAKRFIQVLSFLSGLRGLLANTEKEHLLQSAYQLGNLVVLNG